MSGGRLAIAWTMLVCAVAPAVAAPAREVSIDIVGDDVVEADDVQVTIVGEDVATVDAADVDTFADVVLVGGETSFWCSGVLVGERHVLTAAHCAHATRVAFGNTASDSVAVKVTRSVRHPTLDVAVLTLSKRGKLELHTRRTHLEATPPLGTIRIMGFGVNDRLRLTGFGRKRQVDIEVDGWGCTRARASTLGCSERDELLMRGGRGNDTCLGDSGGPVFERIDGQWRLLAITSRGMKPRKVVCGEGGIYVRMDRISNWLEEELK